MKIEKFTRHFVEDEKKTQKRETFFVCWTYAAEGKRCPDQTESNVSMAMENVTTFHTLRNGKNKRESKIYERAQMVTRERERDSEIPSFAASAAKAPVAANMWKMLSFNQLHSFTLFSFCFARSFSSFSIFSFFHCSASDQRANAFHFHNTYDDIIIWKEAPLRMYVWICKQGADSKFWAESNTQKHSPTEWKASTERECVMRTENGKSNEGGAAFQYFARQPYSLRFHHRVISFSLNRLAMLNESEASMHSKSMKILHIVRWIFCRSLACSVSIISSAAAAAAV